MQDAFCGLFRKWHQLSDPSKALPYVRSAVMNRCRSELRRQARLERRADHNHRPLGSESPEQAAILERSTGTCSQRFGGCPTVSAKC